MSADDKTVLALVMRLWAHGGALLSWEHLGVDVRGHERTMHALSRLLEIGFDVRITPSGVRLVPPDDTPCSHEGLAGLGVPIVCAPVVDSTNTMAAMLARAGAPHGTIVIAEAQLNGRGRHGTTWFSPAGLGVWFSMILRPSSPLPHPGLVSLLSGLCVLRVLRLAGAHEMVLKWANDVLWRRRKVCGILVDRVDWPPREAYVTGIGINVHHRKADFPVELRAKSASVDMALPHRANRLALTASIAGEILKAWSVHEPSGFTEIPEAWNAECGTIGMSVRVGAEGELFVGTVQGVDERGALVLTLPDGTRRAITSGHVEPLVSAP